MPGLPGGCAIPILKMRKLRLGADKSLSWSVSVLVPVCLLQDPCDLRLLQPRLLVRGHPSGLSGRLFSPAPGTHLRHRVGAQ